VIDYSYAKFDDFSFSFRRFWFYHADKCTVTHTQTDAAKRHLNKSNCVHVFDCSMSDFPALQGRQTNCDWGTEVERAEQQERASR